MVRMSDGQVLGFEALARWHHADRGTLQPEIFIPVAESTGLIDSLTWVMLECAVAEAVRWRQAGHRWTISVNLSLPYLERQGVADRIAALVERHALQPGSVVLEVTESLAATQIAQVLGNIARLRMKGFGIAIDDYGTGYATLQQLSRMPFTELKIDRTFVSGSRIARTCMRFSARAWSSRGSSTSGPSRKASKQPANGTSSTASGATWRKAISSPPRCPRSPS